MAPVAVFYLLLLSSIYLMPAVSDHMDTAQSSKQTCLPPTLHSHNEAQDLLLLQDCVGKLSQTQRTLEDTTASLQQTDLLAGVINEQDCRTIRTACLSASTAYAFG